MDQVSPPLRIALAVVLAFAAVWLVALRPKPVEDVAAESEPAPIVAPAEPATPARDTAGASGSAGGSHAARATGGSGSTGRSDAAGAPGGSGSTVAASKGAKAGQGSRAAKRKADSPAVAARDGRGARAVLADLEAGRVVVLLVWDGKSADDRSVRRSVARLDRRDGKVRVHVTTIKRLSDYEAITKGVPITESPTVLVIDRKRRARVISGLTVTAEIDDTVDRALRAS